jgi:hypothetical protein
VIIIWETSSLGNRPEWLGHANIATTPFTIVGGRGPTTAPTHWARSRDYLPFFTAPARQGRLLAMTNKDKSAATWSDVKAELGDSDRAGLLGLVQDLYTSSKDNRNFLHARFRMGGDVLKPYKSIIGRWLRPDLHRHQEYSVAKAKRPIADYKKAAGLPEGVAELTVHYCEQAIRFSKEVGLDDGAYHDALVRMFEQALKAVMALPEARISKSGRHMTALRQRCGLPRSAAAD